MIENRGHPTTTILVAASYQRRILAAQKYDRGCVVTLALALLAPVFVFVVAGDQLALELVHRATGLVDEPAEIAGHLGELAGAEEDQEKEADDHYLLETDPESHAKMITSRLAGYNARDDGSGGRRT
jgi:hypothetical protein